MRPSQNEMFSYHTVVFKFFVVVWSHESDFCAELECASKAFARRFLFLILACVRRRMHPSSRFGELLLLLFIL